MLRIPWSDAAVESQADESLSVFGLTEMTREADRTNGQPTNSAQQCKEICALVSLELNVGGRRGRNATVKERRGVVEWPRGDSKAEVNRSQTFHGNPHVSQRPALKVHPIRFSIARETESQ